VHKYDPAKPFRLYSMPSLGVSEENRVGGSLRCTSHASLERAKQVVHTLELGYSLSHISYGPDRANIVWPEARAMTRECER
jgi:hypothetical protein